MKYRSGRVVGIFGLPCSGKSTLAKAITQASKELIAHVSTGDIARRLSTAKETQHMAEGNLFPDEDKIRAEMLDMVNKRRSQGSEIIILDSCPRFDDQVKWMVENQLVGVDPSDGCLIKVIGDDLIRRAQERMRDDQDQLIQLNKKIEKHSLMIEQMEALIFRYGIPYYTVVNHEMAQAVKEFAKYLGLRK